LKRLNHVPASEDRQLYDRVVMAIQSTLDAETYTELLRAGADMSLEEAVNYGLAFQVHR
jgi:hypothetical protein